MTPKICVLRAPGTNCDEETAYAFDQCGGAAERVHLFRLLENPNLLDSFQILCIPGGFSYGDDVGAGVLFASRLKGHLGDSLRRFLEADKLVLGICNGFQTLLKAGVLPSGAETLGVEPRESTLTWNTNGRYTARWVRLRVDAPHSIFLKGLTEFDVPIAHAEGRLVVTSDAVLNGLKERNQAALRYVPWQSDSIDQLGSRWAANPNGAIDDIAGLTDPTGRVLGLMPHPERFLFATQHPYWTRRKMSGEGTGMTIFRNAVQYFSSAG